jgi:hypothetical protein
VESEVGETSLAAGVDEAFGHEVREPRSLAGRIGREHEAIIECGRADDTGVARTEELEAGAIERDAVAAPGFRGNEDRSGRTLHDRPLGPQAPAHEIDVTPTQGEDLTPARAGRRGER